MIDTLGVEVSDLSDSNFITEKEENDAVLEQIKENYNFDGIKESFDDGNMYESVEFFYDGTMKVSSKILIFYILAQIIESL